MKHAFTDFAPDATGTPRTAADAYQRRLEMECHEDDKPAAIRTPESLPYYADLRDGALMDMTEPAARNSAARWAAFALAVAVLVLVLVVKALAGVV